jgi:hypothetical protein
MTTATTTKNAKSPEFADMGIQRRGQLEHLFIDHHKHAAEASKAIRLDRVYAGLALIELKEGTAHGDWQPYLSKLCKRADIAERTAQMYMKDAVTASKIPQAVLDEAERQGFNVKARHVRQNLMDWLLKHPDDARTPAHIIKDALGTFRPPLTAEQEAAKKAEQEELARKFNAAMNEPDPEEDAYAEREREQQRKRAQQQAFALQIIDAGYKALAKKHHPDVGGTTENFQLLTEAANLLKA